MPFMADEGRSVLGRHRLFLVVLLRQSEVHPSTVYILGRLKMAESDEVRES